MNRINYCPYYFPDRPVLAFCWLRYVLSTSLRPNSAVNPAIAVAGRPCSRRRGWSNNRPAAPDEFISPLKLLHCASLLHRDPRTRRAFCGRRVPWRTALRRVRTLADDISNSRSPMPPLSVSAEYDFTRNIQKKTKLEWTYLFERT